MRYLAVPDFRAKGVADARVAPMSIAVLRPESGEKLVPAPTLLLDTRGKEFPSEARVSVEEALRTCVPPAAHPDPRAVAAAVSFMMEEELEDLATAYDGAVVDADLALLPVPPAPRPLRATTTGRTSSSARSSAKTRVGSIAPRARIWSRSRRPSRRAGTSSTTRRASPRRRARSSRRR